MSDYAISQVYPSDKRSLAQIDALLQKEGITRDGNLDYICAMRDSDDEIIATGSCFGCTLRCFAVSSEHQGEGLLNEIISHLMEVQQARGNLHLFLYTKVKSAKFFGDLGFHEIARVDGTLVFMENRKSGFPNYLNNLEKTKKEGVSAALVMNANPFTLGHQYLAETAAAQCDHLYIFVLSEDKGRFPAADRLLMAKMATAHLPNVTVLPTGPYLISSTTFPTYFLKERDKADEIQCMLDIEIFCQHFVPKFGITHRFVGTEPLSPMTNRYNEVLSHHLPSRGIELCVIPRREIDDTPVSASAVRAAFDVGDTETVQKLVPKTTFEHIYRQQSKETLQ